MEDVALWKTLVQQGGGYVLAGFFGFLMVKMADRWTSDLKASAEREREARDSLEVLFQTTLLHIKESTAAVTAAAAEIRHSIHHRSKGEP